METLIETTKNVLWCAVDFRGRTGRREYWRLMTGVILVALGISLFPEIIIIGCLLAMASATKRRVRDAGGNMRWTNFFFVGVIVLTVGGGLFLILSQASGQDFAIAMIPFMIVGMVVVSGIAAVPYGFLMVKVAAVLLCLAFAVSGGMVAYWVFRPSRTVGTDGVPAVRNTARNPG